MSTKPILTCIEGTNADLFTQALELYVNPGAKIADLTYGKGVFWSKVEPGKYQLFASDLSQEITLAESWRGHAQLLNACDFKALPYASEDFDCVVLDPPYMNGGSSVKESLNKCYRNDGNMSQENVMALYLAGILEARRIVKRNGIVFVKCQAAVADHRQHMTHSHIMTIAPMIGLIVQDEFVLKQS